MWYLALATSLLFAFLSAGGSENKLLALESSLVAQAALLRMQESLEMYRNGSRIQPSAHNFVDIERSLLVHPRFVHSSDGTGGNEKFFVGTRAIPRLGKDFVVYAAGIDNNPGFENYMARTMGSSVFAFDCTNEPKEEWKDIHFHSWCIGQKTDKAFGGVYDRPGKDFVFLSLGEIKGRLNHTYIHMLKMDVEGFEWGILESVARAPQEDLPLQLLFELHTEGANPLAVSPHVVRGRGRRQVTQLLADLHGRGYRVVNTEINHTDKACAEFTLLLVDEAADAARRKTRRARARTRGGRVRL